MNSTRTKSAPQARSIPKLILKSFEKPSAPQILKLLLIEHMQSVLPPTKLGRYRALSPYAGVHVSHSQLGAMSIGSQWDKYGMGSMDKDSSFKLLDAFYDTGGNFIDTAND